MFRTPTMQLTLHGGGAEAMQRDGNDVRGELTLRAGQAGRGGAGVGRPGTTQADGS